MSRIILAGGTIFLATACVAIIDNSGMGTGAGGSGGGVTNGTTTSTTTYVGSAGNGNFTTGGSPTGSASTGAGGNGFGSSSSGAAGSIGTGGDPSGSTGGGFSGSGGSLPDAGFGGHGGTGGGTVDAGRDTGVVGGATYTQVKAIVQQRCVPCHGGFNSYGGFTTHSVSRCGGDKLAVPNDPANSAFLELVQGQNCGGFLMPRGCSNPPCLSANDIQTFTSWINAGAPNN
jgi:hypothetical protein